MLLLRPLRGATRIRASAGLCVLLGLQPLQSGAERSTRLDPLATAGVPRIEESVLGRSAGGRPIQLLTLSADGDIARDRRPGILVVAGAHGHHRRGVELARYQAERLAADFTAGDPATTRLLTERVVYIVPELSPDAFALGRPGNAVATDLDRDRRTDEDPPNDLDGDGEIAWMRWPDPDGEWIVDPDEPRLMRKADPEKSERGTHSMAREGVDDDLDGVRDEDPGEGRHVHRNFSHRFDEFDRRTGPFPMSEPETRALADFVFAHRNIVMAFVYGPEDTLSSPPSTAKPKSRVQLPGILEDDLDLYTEVSDRYRKITGRDGKAIDETEGRVWAWLNFQVGIPAFATDVWRAPTSLEVDDGEGGTTTVEGDRALLELCDRQGSGFVTWRPVPHPDLDGVEVGGLVVDRSGESLWPDEARESGFAAHHDFFLKTAPHGPSIHVREFTVEKLPGTAFRLRAVVENRGDWPTRTATGDRSRRFAPPRVHLDLGDSNGDGPQIILGEERRQLPDLDADEASDEMTWIVVGRPGQRVHLHVTTDPIGQDTAEVTL